MEQNEPIEQPAASVSPSEDRQAEERPLKLPNGQPPRLTCAQARAIVAEVRARLPVEPPRVAGPVFADLWTDWFDPHGLWSAAPDAPLAEAVRARANALLAELESGGVAAPCSVALSLGVASKHWVDGLRAVFEQARTQAPVVHFQRALLAINEPAFEDDVVSHPARQLAADLGLRIGQFANLAPELADGPASSALSRFFPDLSAEAWSEVALAAAVRAYVPAIDPHGEWAPLEEEWALFAGDPLDGEQPSLWGNMLRTPLGVRIASGARAPLEIDDLVLSVDGTETAGLSVEQVEQLARVEPAPGQSTRTVRVLRGQSASARELLVAFPQGDEELENALPATAVRYGDGWVDVITINEVGDRLGDDLADRLALARQADDAPLGVVLDLRGNGGGSTDGAAAAIGLFLPGVPGFALIHRGQVSEILRASLPDPETVWKGPVAVLVDGYTASAAEMIAGALDSYGRGPLLGAHTFGKGCVQEYFDDHSGAGGAALDHAAGRLARRYRFATSGAGTGVVARPARGGRTRGRSARITPRRFRPGHSKSGRDGHRPLAIRSRSGRSVRGSGGLPGLGPARHGGARTPRTGRNSGPFAYPPHAPRAACARRCGTFGPWFHAVPRRAGHEPQMSR